MLTTRISKVWIAKGGCNWFGKNCDPSKTQTIRVNATSVDGEGDITVVSRDTMKKKVPGKDWNRSSPRFCGDACAITGGNFLHIGSSSLSSTRLFHEVLHNFGLPQGNGIMDVDGGHITPTNIDDTAELYGL